MQVTKSKKSPGMQAPAKAGMGATVVSFDIQDDGNQSFTVLGKDNAGATFDISDIAKLTECSSDNPSVVSVDPPSGMTSVMHGFPPPGGTANIKVTATWNDGSIGPFSFTLPVTVKQGPANSIVVDIGTPTM